MSLVLLPGCSSNSSTSASSQESLSQNNGNTCSEIKNIALDLVEVLKPLINAPSNSQNVELAKIALRLKELPKNNKTQAITENLIVEIKNLMTSFNANELESVTKTIQSMTTDIQQLDAICNG